ncbi:MAG TPA: GNAT family N-acetyltransferase [Chlamydiales bacterium]|nr:GNAT family N-acetyltransferase [Chlamydiales bacterium]
MRFILAAEKTTPFMLESSCLLELLEPDEYKIAWPPFKDFQINNPMLYLILEKRGAGNVLTDSKINPSFVLVYNPASYTFLGGELDQVSLQTVSAYLKTLPKVCLACPTGWKYRPFFEKEGFTPVDRIQFRRAKSLVKVHEWKSQLPPEYNISKIEKKNFDQCKWQPILLSFYGDEKRFFDQTVGFCLSDENGCVVSESHALISTGKAEIGVFTDENYRGKNLGTIVCAFMLDYCYAHDLEPFWSCNQTNPASASVAKKLGFEEELRYIFLKWP